MSTRSHRPTKTRLPPPNAAEATASTGVAGRIQKQRHRRTSLAFAGLVLVAMTSTVAVVWPMPAIRDATTLAHAEGGAAIETASAPRGRAPAAGAARRIEAALAKAAPSMMLDGASEGSDRLELRICRFNGKCSALTATDPALGCEGVVAGALCLTWFGTRPDDAPRFEAAVATLRPTDVWEPGIRAAPGARTGASALAAGALEGPSLPVRLALAVLAALALLGIFVAFQRLVERMTHTSRPS